MNNTDSSRQGVYLQSQFPHELLGSFDNQIPSAQHLKEASNVNGAELKSELHYTPEFSTDYLPIASEMYPSNFLTNSYEHQQFVNPSSLSYFNSNKKLCGFLSSTMNNFTELDRIDYSRINEIGNFDQYYQPYQNLKSEHHKDNNNLNRFTSLSRQMDLVNTESNSISQYLQSTQFSNQISNGTESQNVINTTSPNCYETSDIKPNELPITVSTSSIIEDNELIEKISVKKSIENDFVSNESDSPAKAGEDFQTDLENSSNKEDDIKKEKSVEREPEDIEKIKSEKSLKSSKI